MAPFQSHTRVSATPIIYMSPRPYPLLFVILTCLEHLLISAFVHLANASFSAGNNYSASENVGEVFNDVGDIIINNHFSNLARSTSLKNYRR